MSLVVVWSIVTALLLGAEMLTGTFYLLMVAIGSAAAAAIAWTGGSLALQLVAGAAIGIGLTLVLRRTRWAKLAKGPAAAENRDVILDIGEVVQVDAWTDGTAFVRYRGCQWNAQLEPGAAPRPGAQVIKAVRGSTLVLVPVSAPSP